MYQVTCQEILFFVILLYWTVLLILLNNKPESLRDLRIFIISSISSFNIFWYVTASGANAASVNPNGIKALLVKSLIAFYINGNPVFSYWPRSLTRNLPDSAVLDSWVFDSLILAVKLFTKGLRIFETCILVNNDLCGKLVSLLCLMIVLRLLQFHFLLLILIY